MTHPSPRTELPSDPASAALGAAGVGTWAWDAVTGQLCTSRETAALFGLAPEAFPATLEAYLNVVDPADRDGVRKSLAQLASRGDESTRWEILHRIRRTDGAARWIELRGGTSVDHEGRPLRLLALVHDVTERAEQQRARDEACRSLQVLLNNLPGAAYRCLNNRHWTMLFLSPKITALTGYEPAELLGDQSISYADLIHPEDRARVWQDIQQALAADQPFTLTYRIQCRDGEIKWVWEQGRQVNREEYGQTVLEGFITDITDRIRIEHALDDERQRIRAILDTLPEAVVISDMDGNFTDANATFCDMYGYDREEITRINARQLIHPDYRNEFQRFVKELKIRGRYSGETVDVRRDGSEFPTNVRGAIIEFGGKPHCVAVIRDITEERAKDEALRESQARYQLLLENQTDLVCAFDLEGRLTYVSKTYCRTFDLKEEDVLGQTFFPLIHEEDREAVRRAVRLVHRPPYTSYVEERARTRWGWRWQAWVNTAIRDEEGNVTGVVATGRDITVQKKAEQALRDSEQRFVAFMDRLPAAAMIKDASSQLVFANRYFVEEFGVTDWRGKCCSDLFPGDVAEQLMAMDQQTLAEGSATTTLELPHRDGRLHIYRVEEFSIPQQERQRPLLAAIAIDVTDMVRVERQLEEETQRNRQLLETTIDGYILADTEGQIMDVNPSYCRMVGYGRDELLKMNIRQLECSLHPDQIQERIEEMMRQGSARFETQHRAKDGRAIDLEVSITVLGSESRRLVAAFVHDITAKKDMEESLRAREAELAHVARLSTLGEMVAGIAHEVNQPLHAIANFATGSLVRLNQGATDMGALRPNLERIAEQARLAADILGKYRQFARRHRAEREAISIDEIVRQATQLVVFDLREHQVDLHVNIPSPCPIVTVVPNEICQVVVNLLRNACEAMDQTDPLQRSISIDIQKGESHVEVSVQDRGKGLADGNLDRWIQPFETTKPEGLGMGLAVSTRIVADHGGAFWAEPNRDGPGTTFCFTLPSVNRTDR